MFLRYGLTKFGRDWMTFCKTVRALSNNMSLLERNVCLHNMNDTLPRKCFNFVKQAYFYLFSPSLHSSICRTRGRNLGRNGIKCTLRREHNSARQCNALDATWSDKEKTRLKRYLLHSAMVSVLKPIRLLVSDSGRTAFWLTNITAHIFTLYLFLHYQGSSGGHWGRGGGGALNGSWITV
jgi:hypothetical protein